MQANPEFMGLDKSFWAHVRTLSEDIGYTTRTKPSTVLVPSVGRMVEALQGRGLRWDQIANGAWQPTEFGDKLRRYYEYRAQVLNDVVQYQLMNAEQAEAMYLRLRANYNSTRPPTMNKQKGDKARPAYLTSMVNIILDAHLGNFDFDSDPQKLTTVTRDGLPLRTLSRRVDGAFPGTVNPIAIWEIKEYYHTTSFGSRVADGVYETLLDGMELEEAFENTGIDVQHVLIADAHFTWWGQGRPYLCRMVDMLHMGLVDELIFGCEIESRIPQLAAEWVSKYARREAGKAAVAQMAGPPPLF